MPEFLKLLPPTEALALLLRSIPDSKDCLRAAETIAPLQALGRVLAEDIRAPHSLPAFPRSSMDGFALRASDTFGASEAMPAYLTIVGEVPMGKTPGFVIRPGTCASIHTGGMLPDGSDAVIMLEYTQAIKKSRASESTPTEIEFYRSVAEGENVIKVGEDVAEGEVILAAGMRIRPAEIGGCMALGINQLRVVGKPRVGILSSGDEVVPPGQNPLPGQVRDINSYSLAALTVQAGGEPVLYGIVPDNLSVMKAAAAKALAECDLVIITAGSSASARDMTADAIGSLGAPGVLVHGVNIRPGKPTILAACSGKAVIGLPGNPVSALVIAGLFVVPVIGRLLGLKTIRPKASVMARLSMNVASQAGREDWVAVKLSRITSGETVKSGSENVEWGAEPIFGKSNLIFSLAAADGLVCIPLDATGLGAGEIVKVEFL